MSKPHGRDKLNPTPEWTQAWMNCSEKIASFGHEADDQLVLAWCAYENGNWLDCGRLLRKAAEAAYERADQLAIAAGIFDV